MRRTTQRRCIVVAGLGNELLRDDGVGVHAVRLLAAHPPADWNEHIVAVEVGVAVLDAMHLFEWADVILAVDAMRAGGPPGTLYLARDSDIAGTTPADGLHELSLIGALRMIPPREGETPVEPSHGPEVAIIGVEPEIIDYGMELSACVQSVLPRLVEEVRRRVDLLRNRCVPAV